MVRNISDNAGATRDTLQRLVALRRAHLNAGAEPAGYAFGGDEVMRRVIDMGALPDSTTSSVAHSIVAMAAVVKLRGVAYDLDGMSEVQNSRAIPDDVIGLNMDATNVVITTASDLTAFDSSLVEVEYTLA